MSTRPVSQLTEIELHAELNRLVMVLNAGNATATEAERISRIRKALEKIMAQKRRRA